MGMKSSSIFPLMGLFLIFELMLLSVVEARFLKYDFVLTETVVTRMCLEKAILTVNGRYPGPEIRVRAGDRVRVNIKNKGKYGVTIHWHGVKQPRNPWHDGPEYVTQCPIKPGESFNQDIIFSDEEGTLWWHAHSDWHRSTVHGAIIIELEHRITPYRFDDEKVIILGEWYKDDEHEAVEKYIHDCSAPLPDSDGYTINGQPGHLYSCSADDMYRLKVRRGGTYLLRIINAIVNEQMFFGIANHGLTVVGMDGAHVKPITRDFVMIASGQTMDVLVTANQAPDYYYMVGSPYADTVANENKHNITTALLYYDSACLPVYKPYWPALPAYDDSGAAMDFITSLRNYLNHTAVPKNIDRRIFLTVSANQIYCEHGANERTASASMDNRSFEVPTDDYILDAYYSGRSIYNITIPPNRPNPNEDYQANPPIAQRYTEKETAVIMLKYGDAVEIIFQGTNFGAAESHPMHLHGYNFYVVGIGSGNFHDGCAARYNLKDPPHLNTFALPKNGWTTIRFVADNPGVWFMHCHLERHASYGMATVFIVQDGKLRDQQMFPRPDGMPSCLSSSYK